MTCVAESRGPERLPWESSIRLSGDGLGSFADKLPVCDAHPSRGAVDAGSGLTRRGVIYEYIRRHPGTHVRGMAKDLRLATGAMQYHLSWLEKHGFVKTKRLGFYRLVFPTMVFREEQELILGVLSQDTPREMLLRLVEDPSVSQGDLARSMGFSQPTVSWHMERLVELGVIRKRRTPGGMVCEVSVDGAEVLRLARSYYPDAWRRLERRVGAPVLLGAEEPLKEVKLMSPAMVELIGKR